MWDLIIYNTVFWIMWYNISATPERLFQYVIDNYDEKNLK